MTRTYTAARMRAITGTVPARLAGFGAALAVLFGAATLAGGVVDADAPVSTAGAGQAGHGAMDGATAVRGLAVEENGLRIVVDDPQLRRGATEQLRFRIVDSDGHVVRDLDVVHTKRMHLVVARRDLTGFQHLHPTIDAAGAWTAPVRLSAAGSYRLFADFAHDGRPTTLASDLRVDGPVAFRPLPAPASTVPSDGGYDVRLDSGRARAGHEAELRFSVTRDGRPVDVEPYLGADGHLVALRDGDLAFLHVHPLDHGPAGSIGFEATFPTTGAYRLFLQFSDRGHVQTVAFTQEVR